MWDLIEKIPTHWPADDAQGLERANRQRALGGGRDFDQALVIRVGLVLTYLRLHLRQEAVASRYGATQSEGSRALRRLRPVIQTVLPCPEVWQQLAAGTDLSPEPGGELEQGAEQRALLAATEQRGSRPTDGEQRKAP